MAAWVRAAHQAPHDARFAVTPRGGSFGGAGRAAGRAEDPPHEVSGEFGAASATPLSEAERADLREARREAQLRRLARQGSTNWAALDRLAVQAARLQGRLVLPLGRCAARLRERRGWTELGYRGAADFARETCGRSGRWLLDAAALGDAAERWPSLKSALAGEDGRPPLGAVGALLISRVAEDATVDVWIAEARRLPARALRDAVNAARLRARKAGDDAKAGEDVKAAEEVRANEDVKAGDDEAPGSARLPEGNSADAAQNGAGEAALDEATAWDEDPASFDPAARVLLELSVPAPIVDAFEAGFELHRRVEGGDVSRTSFVEALCAEHEAGACARLGRGADGGADGDDAGRAAAVADLDAERRRPPGDDALLRVMRRGLGPTLAELERRLERIAAGARLEDEAARRGAADAPEDEDVAAARRTLDAARLLCDAAGARDASTPELAQELLRLVRLSDELRRLLGELLAAMRGKCQWRVHGYSDLGHYAESRLGVARSTANRLAYVAGAAERLPVLGEEFEAGDIGFEKIALLAEWFGVRRLPREEQRRWVGEAGAVTCKRLRDELRECRRRAGLRRDGPLSDAEWRASRAVRPGAVVEEMISLGHAALASVDDDVVRLRLPRGLAERFLAALSEATLLRLRGDAHAAAAACRAVADGVGGAAASAGPGQPFSIAMRAAIGENASRLMSPGPGQPFSIAMRAVIDENASRATGSGPGQPFSVGGTSRTGREPLLSAGSRGAAAKIWVGLLALLCEYASEWDPAKAGRRRRREPVLDRDGWRCTAPGCTARANLEKHHVQYRSQGGADDPSNLTTLCRFHHQAGEHGALLKVRGRAPDRLRFGLGRDGLGGLFADERR
ncbi:MAG: HNH endonuclease, partial [Candidatus Polarisedimenticolia bacterium]